MEKSNDSVSSVDEIEVGERKDYNVKLKYVDLLSDKFFLAMDLSSELMITLPNEQERIYDAFHKTMVSLLGYMAASEKYIDFRPDEKRKEIMLLSPTYDKGAWLKMDAILMEVAKQLGKMKVMDEKTKKVPMREAFK